MGSLTERARAVRLAIFDVDGVMTDGTLFIGAQGEAFKAFNTLDGQGVKMLQSAGVATAIISGRSSEAVARRAAELAIAHVVQGSSDKAAAFEALIAMLDLTEDQCAFVGDDLPDLAVMRRCGLAVAVANAARCVNSASWCSRRRGSSPRNRRPEPTQCSARPRGCRSRPWRSSSGSPSG